MNYSIIIPTYDEIENIKILLPRIERLFKGKDYEVIVVDDSSPDGTGDIVKAFAKRNRRIRLVTRTRKEGIGAALREGYDKAKKDVIMSTDADLSFDTKDLLRLLAKIESGYDLVVGDRHGKDGAYEKPTFGVWMKGLISSTGNIVFTNLFRLPVRDMSANFRAVRRSVWKKLHTQERGNVILGEMIIKAHRKGYKVGSIPVVFRDRRYGVSKLSLAREVPKFVVKILKYRFL